MKNNSNVKIKPPYLLGLLCLIPVVGIFVGVALILYGIFKYKNMWLIVMGICSPITTILLSHFELENLKYGKDFGVGLVQVSQEELNHLVKDIEYYKLQNGVYPNSLEELKATDNLVLISDPFLVRKMDNNIKATFQYGKIDRRYKLFSVGIDGIPNTPDDIYPEIKNIDSNKIGLISK